MTKTRSDVRLEPPIGETGTALLVDNQPNKLDPAIALLTIREAAEFLTISPSGIRRLQQSRQIPFFKVGGSIRFAKGDLVSYLARQRIGSVGE